MGVPAQRLPPPVCATVKTFPPIPIVPERTGPLFADTENPTVPFPLPLAPEVTVMKLAVLVAVQLQSPGAVTDTVPVPPLAGNCWLDGLTAVTQAVPVRKGAIEG